MLRRKFLQQGLAASAGMMLSPLVSKANWLVSGNAVTLVSSDIEKFFLLPPANARPWCFYHWMNGNITSEGITADLESMKQMGIGGAICFNSAVGIPRGPVDYASEEWMEATAHTIREAQRLGLEISIQNSPGYSGCGGPWVTPEMSMQQLVWTEKIISGHGKKTFRLLQPYAKHGYYRDAFVIAYPSSEAEKKAASNPIKSILFNGAPVDANVLSDGNPETKLRLEANEDRPGTMIFEFTQPVDAMAITILRKPEIPQDLFDGPRDHPPVFLLESSMDNVNFSFVCTLTMPALREMDTPGAASFQTVTARYFKLTTRSSTWVSNVTFHASPRITGWPGKLNYTGGSSSGNDLVYQNGNCIDPDQVVDLSTKMDGDGNLKWNVPKGDWTILRIGHTTTGEEPAAHPDSGKGLEIDKLRKDALDLHFHSFLDKLINRVKPQIGTTFKSIVVDSWEAGKQNWTAGFPEMFKEKRNYSLLKFIPALTGRIVGSTMETERFLWDFRKTHAELLSENFYGYFQTLCKKRGLQFHAEPYGDGTLDSLQIAQHLDVTMSEFWTRYIYGSDVTSKQAASAAHVYGKNIVAAESFTGMPATSKWTDYPYSLKAEGDYFFCLGVNRLVFHTVVHQPFLTGKPGMTMGPFGTHFDRNNTWSEQAYGWTGYLQRAQYLLQQGNFVADVCYFKGDEPLSGIPDIYQFLPRGYAGDVINADGLAYLQIKDGIIRLSHGMNYKICIMARIEAILPETLVKLIALVRQGMTLVVSNKPFKALGHASDGEVEKLANDLYGKLDGKSIMEVTLGKGKVLWAENPGSALALLDVQPDFSYQAEHVDATIHYIHKKLPGLEYYFISNHRRRKERLNCSFRLSGLQPEIWNPETGEISPVLVSEVDAGRTSMSLDMDPAQSIFLVFRKPVSAPQVNKIARNGIQLYPPQPLEHEQVGMLKQIFDDFSISLWLKPDSFAHPGRGMVFHPAEGEVLFGKNHVSVGLGAGQNGFFVYERGKGTAKPVLSLPQSVQGWTHVCLRYEQGCPSLYVNGEFSKKGVTSTFTVHPGLFTPAVVSQFASYFEGNYTQPMLQMPAISLKELKMLFGKGLPEPTPPGGIELLSFQSGHRKAQFWENGKYTFYHSDRKSSSVEVSTCSSIEIKKPWKVTLTADKIISLPLLQSLHLHDDFDVRHFSGTASYQTEIEWKSQKHVGEYRLFLDLGRVEVLAEVRLNGKSIGQVWKEPYRIEVTNALIEGKNVLEVLVTTLWPNRLIGDEYLPSEHLYSPHGFIEKLPGWFVKNQPKPGKRKAFSVWKNLSKTDPLLESGLLGPVHIRTAAIKSLDI